MSGRGQAQRFGQEIQPVLPPEMRVPQHEIGHAEHALGHGVFQEAGGGDLGALVTALTRACWEEDRNIAEDDVIRDCLSAAGFDPGLAFSGMLQGAEIYPRNLEEAVAADVFGVPFFKVGAASFWGQDRIDFLAAHMGVTL